MRNVLILATAAAALACAGAAQAASVEVKDAVARDLISDRRYHSYLGMFHGSAE